MLVEKNEKIEEAEKKIALIVKSRSKLQLELESLKETISDKDRLRDKFEKFKILEAQISSKRKNLEKSREFFHDTETCPTCTQGIEHDFKVKMIEDKTRQIEEIEAGIEKLISEKTKLSNRIEEISTVSDKILDLTIKLNSTSTQRDQLEGYIDELRSDMKSVVESVEQDNIPEIESELDAAIDTYNAEVEDRSVLQAASVVLKDGGIKAKIIKQYVPVINKLINKYLSAMDFFVQFELNEQFEETIKSRFRDEFSYASFSEGEKMRINLAILFTWRAVAKLRNSINTNLLIMDEVFDSSLDSTGTEEFMKILINLTQDTNTFIISHKTDQLWDKFERVIRFEKHKNFSRIAT